MHMVEWPSGLRRQVKALISSEARVQIPSQPSTSNNTRAHLAQTVERLPFKPVVVGSIPTVGVFFIGYFTRLATLAEWSKALRSGRSISGCVGSSPTGCI